MSTKQIVIVVAIASLAALIVPKVAPKIPGLNRLV